MKLWNKLKIGFFCTVSVGLIIPSLTSCWGSHHHKKSDAFDDFKKAAEAESFANIIKNANPKADGWDRAENNNLYKIGDPIIKDNTITILMEYDLKSQSASFSITYVPQTKYNVTNWKCSDGPNVYPNFYSFTRCSESEAPINIIRNATPKPDGWAGVIASQVEKIGKARIVKQNITIVIKAYSPQYKEQEVASFSIQYVKAIPYDVSKWICSVHPNVVPTIKDFKGEAEEAKPIDIVMFHDHPRAKGWPTWNVFTLSKLRSSETPTSVTFVILWTKTDKTTQTAEFTINYVQYLPYDIHDWFCSKQPY